MKQRSFNTSLLVRDLQTTNQVKQTDVGSQPLHVSNQYIIKNTESIDPILETFKVDAGAY